MRRNARFHLLGLVTGLILLTAACQAGSWKDDALLAGRVTPSATAQAEATSPTQRTAPATATPAPTATATPTPTPWRAARLGTPYPTPQQALTHENAAALRLLARFGDGDARAVVFFPQRGRLAVGTAYGVVWYDAATFQRLAFWPTDAAVERLARTPDERYLAAGVADRVLVWDVDQAELWAAWAMPDPDADKPTATPAATSELAKAELRRDRITALAISPDGRWLAAGAFERLAVWDLATRALHRAEGREVLPPSSVLALRFSADGQYLYSAAGDNINVFRVEPWARLEKPFFAVGIFRKFGREMWNHFKRAQVGEPIILDLALAPSGRYVAAAFPSGVVLVWDLTIPVPQTNGKVFMVRHYLWPYRQRPTGIWFDASDTLHLVVGRHWLQYNVATYPIQDPSSDVTLSFTPLVLEPQPEGEAAWVAVSATGRLALVEPNGIARTSDMAPLSFQVNDVAIHPSQPLAALVGDAAEVVLRDLSTGRVRASVHLADARVPLRAVVLSPQGSWGLAADAEGTIWRFDWEAGTAEAWLTLPRAVTQREAVAMAMHPQGRWVALATAQQVFVWDVDQRTNRMNGHTRGPITDLAFSPEGTYLARTEYGLAIWDVAARRPWFAFSDLTKPGMGLLRTLAWHPHEPEIAVAASDGRWRIWRLPDNPDSSIAPTQAPDATYAPYPPRLIGEPMAGPVLGVAFNPSGDLLAAYGAGVLQMVDPRDGHIISQVEIPEATPTNTADDEVRFGSVRVAFTPDGRALILIAPSGAWWVWGVPETASR
ncbi:MAG: WD40 repeat domain-containing protein [Chloroflexi bacterium]|nr:WD40 repeat domain-containing protein [Chloroflexota bacterium]